MRKSICVLTFAALATLPALQVVPVNAADHREAPVVNGLPEGDIGDVFAFLDPNDNSRLVLSMGVNGFAIPAVRGSYSFSQEFLYQFKIDNDGDFKEDWVVQAIFGDTGAAQIVGVHGPARPKRVGAVSRFLRTEPTVIGPVGRVLGDPTRVQAFAGLTDDTLPSGPGGAPERGGAAAYRFWAAVDCRL